MSKTWSWFAKGAWKKKKHPEQEEGYTLLEVVATTSAILALTAGAGAIVYHNVAEKTREDALDAASAAGYTQALDIMTGFEYSEDEEIYEAIEAQLSSMSTEDYVLGYEGADSSSLCVFATSPELDTDEYIASSGSCDEEDVVQVVENTIEDTVTELVYQCEVNTMVASPVERPFTDVEARIIPHSGNSILIEEWSRDELFPMVAGREYVIELDGKYQALVNAEGYDLDGGEGEQGIAYMREDIANILAAINAGEDAWKNGAECLQEIRHIGDDAEVQGLHFLGPDLKRAPESIPASVNSLKAAFFANVDNVVENVEKWDTRHVENMDLTFAITNAAPNVRSWDVSNVKSMSGMFMMNTSFNDDLSNWKTDSLENASFMFAYTTFNNGDELQVAGDTPLDWDTSNLKNANSMFGMSGFNQDIGNWDVSNVEDMSAMFSLTHFDWDISDWDTSNVKSMDSMFGLSKFNQDISGWDLSSLETMRGMFQGSNEFNQDLSDWDTSNVQNMGEVFKMAVKFNNGAPEGEGGKPLDWDTSSATNMEMMFNSNRTFNQDISDWDVSNVENMEYMFSHAVLFDQDLSDWDTSNVTTMNSMFNYASEFSNLGKPLPWDTSRVTNMDRMFNGAQKFSQDLSAWNVGNVESYIRFESYSGITADKKPKFL